VIESVAITVAAVGFLLWPAIQQVPAFASRLMSRRGEDKKVGLTYQSAVASLAEVRSRLLATECLKDSQKGAINTLTLALVDGSDKP
jgi:hypothetical protein